MYIGRARQTALDLIKQEGDIFNRQDVHQKVEILGIKVLEADSRTSFLKISGQLIRSRRDADTPVEVLRFEMSMNLSVNYDLAKNAVFPFVVSDINYQQETIRKRR